MVAMLSAPSWAEEEEEHEEPEAHVRTFLGGFTSGAYVTAGSFAAGPLGIAGDLGMQFTPHISASLQLRASTVFILNHFQVTPSVEWSLNRFSISLGIGGAALFTVLPLMGPEFRTVLAIPLGLGLTLGERETEVGLRSVRINLEFTLLVDPTPVLGIGGALGISVGSLTR
jgi:hypothetical protein